MKTTTAAGLAALTLVAACAKAQGEQGGSGRITLADFQARRVERLMKADANGDGKISKDEFAAYMRQRFAARGGDDDTDALIDRMFSRQDKNGDGFITKDEIQQSAAEQFGRLDADHKGYITSDQMREGRGGGEGHWGGGQGQGDGQNGGQGGGQGG